MCKKISLCFYLYFLIKFRHFDWFGTRTNRYSNETKDLRSVLVSQMSFSTIKHFCQNTTVKYTINLQFCGFKREALGFTAASLNRRHAQLPCCPHFSTVVSAALFNNRTPPTLFYHDLLIIGADVGGHDVALNSVQKVLSL
ncbi:unnamed protein product [Lupinus luteus]|uniref:Uncharacterized protein n=1 Tax=Lupinus luteus TaxID=3873 RepID=A0AAV1YAU3_LUPLU